MNEQKHEEDKSAKDEDNKPMPKWKAFLWALLGVFLFFVVRNIIVGLLNK